MRKRSRCSVDSPMKSARGGLAEGRTGAMRRSSTASGASESASRMTTCGPQASSAAASSSASWPAAGRKSKKRGSTPRAGVCRAREPSVRSSPTKATRAGSPNRGARIAPYSSPALRVAFLTQDLQLSGGVGVIVEHAAQLASRHGFDVSLVLTRPQAEPDWAFRGLEHLHVVPLEQAAGMRFDVALSTWWETAEHLFELDAGRHASFVQSLEERFYAPGAPERMAGALALDLPVRFVTEARWIARALERLQPGNRVLFVRNGIDKQVYAPPIGIRPRLDGPLRILLEGDPAVWFKGIGEALA